MSQECLCQLDCLFGVFATHLQTGVLGVDASDGETCPVRSRALDQLVGVLRTKNPLRVAGTDDLDPDRLIVLSRLFEGIREGLPTEPRNVPDPWCVFDLDTQRLVDIETVHPGLGEAERGKGPRAHIACNPGKSVLAAHVGEWLDHFRPSTTPPFDDILGTHIATLLDGILPEWLDVGSGLPFLDPVTILNGVGSEVFEIGQMGDRVPNGPWLVGGHEIPNFDWDALQGLIEKLLFSYEIGEDVTHPLILIVGFAKRPSQIGGLPGSFGLLLAHVGRNLCGFRQTGEFVEAINHLTKTAEMTSIEQEGDAFEIDRVVIVDLG